MKEFLAWLDAAPREALIGVILFMLGVAAMIGRAFQAGHLVSGATHREALALAEQTNREMRSAVTELAQAVDGMVMQSREGYQLVKELLFKWGGR